MASKRRGGFRPPELKGTLGTLLRTTTDVVRGALERGAREGRARLDDVRVNRRRQDALADLGEVLLDLIRRGEIDLDELPEARDLVRQLDELDGEADVDDAPRASARRRFDDRDADDRAADHAGPRHGHGHELGSGFASPRGDISRGEISRRDTSRNDIGDASRWDSHRSDVPRRDARGSAPPRRTDDSGPHRRPDDDGTVSSGAALRATRPTTPARPRDVTDTSRAPTKPIKGIARPAPDTATPDEAPASPSRRYQLAPDPHRKGGISFDDDDLADYMHPDDVPTRDEPAKGAPDRDADDHD